MQDEAPELAEKQSITIKINKHGGKRANCGGRRPAGRQVARFASLYAPYVAGSFDESLRRKIVATPGSRPSSRPNST